jgi:nitroreductase
MMDVFQAMTEMRAMRRIKPDPVPREEIEDLIRYATHAPSGSNAQAWRFVVVTDAELRRQIGEIYGRAIDIYVTKINTKPEPHQTQAEWERLIAAVRWQGDHMGEIPVHIFPCLKNAPAAAFQNPLSAKSMGANIFPAVQNLLLAARAKGLGATLTTLHLMFEQEINALLKLPERAGTFALIPLGYPVGNFGPTRRLPVDDVIGWDGWE